MELLDRLHLTRPLGASIGDYLSQPTGDGGLGLGTVGPSFTEAAAQGNLPNVSFIDPAFDAESSGTSGDDHPFGDIRLGERFIADAYHALANAGYLDNTVFIITFDEWGGFYDHVPPPRVVDDTDPAHVDHTGDGATPTEGRLIPDYRQLGFRVPAIVVSNCRPGRHGLLLLGRKPDDPSACLSTRSAHPSTNPAKAAVERDGLNREKAEHGPGWLNIHRSVSVLLYGAAGAVPDQECVPAKKAVLWRQEPFD